ncbi:tryptophan--tRNA ligase [Arthroderma uncinatum]|uniref:tryptophan--tRNA ligase n=1 Tax=Arthroderma uncinatum TaxID=74035 RepID=UPI00144A575E|nr:tryptophan--tRNA ligase [Arthroderma uncinatum]KAF3483585.1 tryptophan--tRNA ligase [Arthroderma uncinatum]
MFSPSSFRSVLGATKRVKVVNLFRPVSTISSDIPPEFLAAIQKENGGPDSAMPEIKREVFTESEPVTDPKEWQDRINVYKSKFRLPKAVQAAYMKPLKRKLEYCLPVCNLQLRSYSARHVEFFADFALRAAYYLNIPATGPVPLPRIVERWTVIRSPFVHAKSKENFERITCRRLVQLQDGHPDSVQLWLAFLRKHAFHGVGMKANVFEHTSLDVGKEMDEAAVSLEKALDAELAQFGSKKGSHFPESIASMLERESQTRTGAPLTENAVIFSGIQPTGIPHLGNYLGALRAWVDLQQTSQPDTKLIYSIVDLHALTIPKDAAQLRQWRKQALAVLLAVGIKPERATIFYQSAVPAHSELMWILSTNSSMGYLSRMTQWKSKLQLPEDSTLEESGARARLKLGLFSYPVLQAADVLVHRANYIPVGEDQKQHIEFAREVANGFNHLYGPILTVPEALISPAKRVMSLKDPKQKMSKSHTDPKSRILLTDTPRQIRDKIRTALTDSKLTITYEPEERPGVSNLLEMLSHLEGLKAGPSSSGRSVSDIASEYKSASFKALKGDLSEKLIELISPIRERYTQLMDEDGKMASSGSSDSESYLDTIARKGAEEASANADITMKQVKKAIGLL